MKVDSGSTRLLPVLPGGPIAPESAQVQPQAPAPASYAVQDGFDEGTAPAAARNEVTAQAADPTRDVARANPSPGKVPQAALNHLPPEDRARVQQIAAGERKPRAQSNLNQLVDSKGFQSMGAQQQANVLKSYLAGPPTSVESTKQLTSLVNDPGFHALSPAQKGRALDVFNATDVGGREQLVNLTQRKVNGQSALLDKDKEGNTLLGDLHAMATGPLAQGFADSGVSRASLLSSTMQEAGSPGEINQGNRNTCTVTSMQYMLNQSNPAEYVRLMKGLTSPSGQVELSNGDTLSRVPDSVAPDSSAAKRSDTERLFQSAMMDYANGALRYSDVTDHSTGANGKDQKGLQPPQEKRALDALFGQDFEMSGGPKSRDPDQIVNQLQARNGQETLVGMSWGNNGVGGHAVVAEKVEDGRVYFRNPWGPTDDAKGTTYDNPPRRLEDASTRLESMSLADFKQSVRHAMLPS